MAHSMFCTDYVATVVYGGSAYAERGSIEDIRFDEGVRMGSMGLLLHSMTGKKTNMSIFRFSNPGLQAVMWWA